MEIIFINFFSQHGWPSATAFSSTYKRKKVGCLFAIRAIWRPGLNDHPLSPRKSRRRMLNVRDHLIPGSRTAQPSEFCSQVLWVTTHGQLVADRMGGGGRHLIYGRNISSLWNSFLNLTTSSSAFILIEIQSYEIITDIFVDAPNEVSKIRPVYK